MTFEFPTSDVPVAMRRIQQTVSLIVKHAVLLVYNRRHPCQAFRAAIKNHNPVGRADCASVRPGAHHGHHGQHDGSMRTVAQDSNDLQASRKIFRCTSAPGCAKIASDWSI
jgi:hypothetical protein